MTHIITGLCLRAGNCVTVCPVDCIVPGDPVDEWPWYYIDPAVCTDCGECVKVCPYNAIWPLAEVPEPLRADIRAAWDFFERGPGRQAPRWRGPG
jgi:ferredoxin